MNYDKTNYERITKAQAREIHEQGGRVYILPSKANICSMWWNPPPDIPSDRNFNKFINEYLYYNCNKETGTGLAFFTITSIE